MYSEKDICYIFTFGKIISYSERVYVIFSLLSNKKYIVKIRDWFDIMTEQ